MSSGSFGGNRRITSCSMREAWQGGLAASKQQHAKCTMNGKVIEQQRTQSKEKRPSRWSDITHLLENTINAHLLAVLPLALRLALLFLKTTQSETSLKGYRCITLLAQGRRLFSGRCALLCLSLVHRADHVKLRVKVASRKIPVCTFYVPNAWF